MRRREADGSGGRAPTPIVPSRSIAGRSLMAVIAIMTFLASLTAGAVQLIAAAADDWGADIAREVTIQVRPVEGRDIEAEIAKAVAAAVATDGVASVRAWTEAETARLLAPWLGSGLNLADLPVPRLIVVDIAPGAQSDFADLRRRLGESVAGATLDDHRGWIDRLAAMARSMVALGLGVLALMLAATALSVVFATQGAMAGNRAVIEVLHFVGAEDRFIAREFQRHFLWLGLKGGLIGGALAALLFAIAALIVSRLVATPGGDQIAALFGTFAIGWRGYATIAVTVVAVAVVAALTSRLTVGRLLRGQPD